MKTSRSRAAAAALTGLALLGTGAAITSQPANAAPPTEDCKQPYPVADGFTAGDLVTGLTVDTGVMPEGFTGKILGVIHDGIAPGVPMVMARLTSDEIDRVGIWQGMSGSPVYAADGRLIGAVAYGLTWGPSPVAGITPFEHMDEFLDTTVPAKVAVGPGLAKRVAATTDVTVRQALQGFEQLPMPMSFSGLSQHRLNQLQGKNGPDFIKTRGALAMGAASSEVAAEEKDLVAGGNLGAAISYGDITAGGVGTVTSVCEGRLVGFGHPMGYFGKTTLGMMPAEAIYVQEDPAAPGFKVANMGVPAGTIDQDRLTGISGPVGEDFLPKEAVITSTVSYGDKEPREGTSHSLVKSFNADVTFAQLLANHDRVIDTIQAGSEKATFQIRGADAAHEPFLIEWSDRYVSSYDISYDSSYEAAEIVYLLSRMKGASVDTVTATADVSDSTAVWRLTGVQQKRGAKWVTLSRRQPAVVKPGGTLQLRAQLARGSNTKRLQLTVAVPNRTTRDGFLEITGGLSMWENDLYSAKNPAQLEAAVAAMTANDQVNASLQFFKRGQNIVKQAKSASQDLPVRGRVWAEVAVRR
ncbi:hypothetical protein [Nocardioides sp.]|uniref:hypothetical protein n=1 Tax=Nocardioides sp. TaxID=35761 RepID=UPI002ED157AE